MDTRLWARILFAGIVLLGLLGFIIAIQPPFGDSGGAPGVTAAGPDADAAIAACREELVARRFAVDAGEIRVSEVEKPSPLAAERSVRVHGGVRSGQRNFRFECQYSPQRGARVQAELIGYPAY